MKLHVSHSTRYAFDPPMRGVAQSLRLWPSTFEGQKVQRWDVSIEGGTRGAGFRDGAGDWIETITFLGPVGEIVVNVEGIVETENRSGLLKGHREKVPPMAYLRHTDYTRPDAEFKIMAERAIADGKTGLDLAHHLSSLISDAIKYTPGETDPSTTAAEALASGNGVCQDHAHALIAAALAANIPARYVTGYLHAQGDIAEASHAWAELYVSDFGWVGFDASNRACPDEHYVRVGSGFDSIDAAPIRGVAQGSGTEALSINVSVVEAAQQ